MAKLISALPALNPITVTDIETGEILSRNEWIKPVNSLLTYVQQEVAKLFFEQGDRFISDVQAVDKLGSMNSFARQRGYSSNYKENLPSPVKAKSRINELVLHKFASETASYVLNPNPKKQPPSFGLKVNLGAVDKQMVTLSINNDIITMVWKVWDRELFFEFKIPAYITKRDIRKFSLPTIEHRKGKPIFIFTIEENPAKRTPGKHSAGVDLGRAEPYTMVIATPDGKRFAHYTTTSRLKQLNNKRERLLVEKKHIANKIKAYDDLGLDASILKSEKNYKAGKIKAIGKSLAQQIGSDLVKKLIKHDVNILNVENLTWVTGAKYGSKWNHSAQQDAITQAALRHGIKTRKVNPKNTSQLCSGCGAKITHHTNSRTVWCSGCKVRLDRDYNAAMNISLNKCYPTMNRVSGGNHSATAQVTGNNPNSVIAVNSAIVSFAT